MPFNVGPLELVIVLVIALLILGPGRLPEVGSALGKSIREFRKAATDVQESTKIDTAPKKAEPTATTQAPAQVEAGGQPVETATPAEPAAPAATPATEPVPAAPAAAEPPESSQPNELSESPQPNELSQPRT